MHPKRLENPEAKRPKAPRKDYDRLVKAAWDAGWWCERRRSNYIFCYHPNESDYVVVKSTPSKQGTLPRTARLLRKLGVDV